MTRRFPQWSAAVALMLTTASAALAQGPMPTQGTIPAQGPMTAPMPPPPPPMMPAPVAANPGPAPAGVAALVNGQKIFRFQVANQALKVNGPQLLNTMILIELIRQEAAKQHIVITPGQIDMKLAEIRQRAASQVPGGLDAILAQRHQTLADLKEQILPQMEAEALVAKTLPPASDLEYHARHLLIKTTNAGPAAAPGAKPPHTDAEALALIAKAQADLKAGKSFGDVANQYTEDESGKGKGGDLGIIDAKTQFDPNFLKAALALKAGEVTPTPVKSVYGYHLIKIDSTSAAPLPADKKLYDDARSQQIQQAIPAYVQGLQKKAKIVNYLSTP